MQIAIFLKDTLRDGRFIFFRRQARSALKVLLLTSILVVALLHFGSA
jgi:hypothetical protein